MSVSVEQGRKIGLVAAIAILIGSVIGIGIFFKNGSVFKFNNFNDVGVIVSWVIAGIIALTTALSFSVFGFSKKSGAGVAGAIGQYKKEKLSRFVGLLQPTFYYGLIIPAVAFFSAEALLFTVLPSGSKPEIWHLFVLAVGLYGIIILINIISIKLSSGLQIIATALKFVPLIAVALIGIIAGTNNPSNSLFNPETKIGEVGTFKINGLLASLPSILFAFDSFLGIGSIQNKIKNSRRNVPIALVVGIVIVTLVYLFITIGQALVGQGFAYGVVAKAFEGNKTVIEALTITINAFILISIVGVLNSLVLVNIHSSQYVINEHIISFWHVFARIKNNRFQELQGAVLSLVIFVFWMSVYAAINITLNTDAYVDLLSNFPTLFFFVIYGLTICIAFNNKLKESKAQKNSKNKKNNLLFEYNPSISRHANWVHFEGVENYNDYTSIKNNSYVKSNVGNWIYPIWIIGIVGCFFVFGYQLFYGYTINTWLDPQNLKLFSFGLFYDNGISVVPWIVSLLFFLMIFIFITYPFVNDLILKGLYNKQKLFSENKAYLLSKLLI